MSQPAAEPDAGAGLLELYDEALPTVYGYLLSRCGDVTLAEDLTAECFLAAAAAVRKSEAPPLTVGWLIGVARHKLVDHWRDRERERRGLRSVVRDQPAVEDPWEERLDALRARDALARLGPHHRAAMTDPFDALRAPVTPVDPDPRFAARLRRALRDVLEGGEMTEAVTEELAWPPTLTPYIAVRDARSALRWYADVLGARPRGEMYVGADGSVGHAELAIGDAVLMLSEGSTQVPVQPPSGGTFSHTLHLQVDDVDATVGRAREQGAAVEREPVDEPYGRIAVIVDPFGHRWMLNRPPGRAVRQRPGDVAYLTMVVPDDERARAFYGTVLGWRFKAGSVPRGWQVEEVQPMVGLSGGGDREVQLCYRVADIGSGLERVRRAGGQAGSVERRPYGLLAECVDDQGTRFQLWQPVD